MGVNTAKCKIIHVSHQLETGNYMDDIGKKTGAGNHNGSDLGVLITSDFRLGGRAAWQHQYWVLFVEGSTE